jgi:fido (protein-threonine AMPylation protein)
MASLDKGSKESNDRWPLVSFESCEWDPARPIASHSFRDIVRRPYQAAIVPLIAKQTVMLSSDTLTAAAEATAAIASFDAEVGNGLIPFEALLLRSESAASSQIEQLTASAKSVLMAEAGDESKANARVIAANTIAMRRAIALADDLSGEAIIEMHRTLLGESAPEIVGRWRDQQVWIGGRLSSPHDAAFVPPHHDRIPAAMDDLIAFLSRVDVPAFQQALLGHAHFETIHPFPDGNGRTGRALLKTSTYFEALGAYRAGDPDTIVRLGAEATFLAIENARQLAADVSAVQERWHSKLGHLRSDALAHRVVDILPASPIVFGTDLMERFAVSAPTANSAIAALNEAGILTRANAGLKFRRWIAHDIATALDDFAARSGRRSYP